MTKETQCRMISPLVAKYIRGDLNDENKDRIEIHLARCDTCRKTAEALKQVIASDDAPRTDLWPRLAARLAEIKRDSETNHGGPVRLPPFNWGAAAATAIVILTHALTPEPIRLLVILGII